MPTVRTKKQPWKEIEVSDREFLDLKRQGLLVDVPVERPTRTKREPSRTTTQVEPGTEPPVKMEE